MEANRLPFTSKEFNSNYICRIDGEICGLTLHQAVGFYLMIDLLGDRAEKTLARLATSKAEKCVLRPFHGVVVSFYRH